MANLSSVDYSSGVLATTTTGTVMTINAVGSVAGTPAANALTVQPSSIAFSVTVSSLSGVQTVSVSSVTGGTINTIGSLSSGTLASLSSGAVAIRNGANTASVLASATVPSSTDVALVVALSPNGLNPNGTAPSTGSAPVTAASDQPSIGVVLDSARIALGTAGSTVSVAPVFLSFGAASSGNTTLVSSQASKRIRVLSMALTASASLDVQFLSGAPSSGVLSGPLHSYGAGWGIVLPFSPIGHFQTVSSEGLVINLSAGSSVGGSLTYILV